MFRTFIFDSNNKLLVKGDITIDDGTSNTVVLQSDSNDLNSLRVNGNAKVTSNVYAMNRLGVGTSNPSERVDVLDNLKASSNLYAMNAVGIANSNPTEKLDIYGNNKVRSNLYVLSNISIGHSNPTERLDVLDNLKASSNLYAMNAVGIANSNPTEKLDIYGNNKVRSNLYVLSNISIGHSNPTEKLDVTGNAKFSSNAYILNRVGINTSNPAVGLEVNTTDAVLISKGTTGQRPSVPVTGHIRYNTDNSQFEGFGAGSAWGSLGGVKSTNQQTYVSAEEYPTSNDDNIRFVNSNIESMRITRNRLVGINTSNPTERVDIVGNTKVSSNIYIMSKVGINTSNPAVGLEVNTTDAILIPQGTTVQRPSVPVTGHIRYNSDNSQFEGFGAGNAWGSLGGVKSTNQQTYVAAEQYPTSNDDNIRFVNSNIESMRITRARLVGINTSNPTERVDIVGNTKVSSNIYIMSKVGINTSNPAVGLEVNTTDAILIPQGTTVQRPSVPVTGHIRYNSDNSQFEGFGAGNAWGSLGGVKSTNQQTYVSAEQYPTSNDDNIRFVNSNIESVRITRNRLVGINTSNPSERLEVNGNVKVNSNMYVLSNLGLGTSNPSYQLDVVGEARVQSNLYIGMDNNTASGTYTSGKILFGGTSGDLGYQMAQIAVRKYSGTTEASEMVIAKFNDPTSNNGHDRVRIRAAAVAFDTYTVDQTPSNIDGDFTSSNIRMYITPSGNVGIGTTNPQSLLEVVGDVKSTTVTTSNVSTSNLSSSNAGICNLDVYSIVASNIVTSNLVIVNSNISTNNVTAQDTIYSSNIFTSNMYASRRLGVGTSNPQFTFEVQGTAYISGASILSNSLSVTGPMTLCNSLNVSGATVLSNALTTYNGPSTFSNNVIVSGATSLSNTLTVAGAALMSNDLTVFGKTTLCNQANLYGATTLSNTLTTYNGTTTHSNAVIVSGITTLSNNLNVSGPMTLCNTVNVSGAALLSNTLLAYGATTLSNNVTISGATTLSNTLNVSGAALFSNGITVFNGTSTFSNNAIVSGSIGVGTSTITEKIQVSGGKIYTDQQVLGNSNDSAAIPSFSFKEDSNTGIFHASNDAIGFTTAGVEKMRINSNGLVGIGTTTPSEMLEVTSNAKLDSNLYVMNKLGVGTSNITNTSNIILHVAGNARIEGNLDVSGIYNILNTDVKVTDQFTVSNNGTGPAMNVYQMGAQAIADFYDDSNIAMRIADGGSVGIKTLTPSETLDVNGSAKVGTNAFVMGNLGVGTSNVFYTLDVSGTQRTTGAAILSNTLLVFGASTFSNNITATGTATFSNNVIVSGTTTLSNNLNVSGPMTLCNSMNVSGAALLSNTVLAYGATTLSNSVTISGATTLSNSLNVSGATLLSNALTTYNGTTTHSNAVIVSGITTLSNNLNVSGPMTLCNSMNVAGAAILSNTVLAYGATTLSNSLIVTGTTTLSNSVTISGATTLSNNLNVSGATVLSNAFTTFNGPSTFSNNVIVSGTTTLSNNLNVSGPMTLCNSMNVSGTTILSNAVTTYNGTTTHSNAVVVSGITTLSNNLNVSGPMTLCNTLNVSGAALLSNTLLTYGATTLSNTVIISGATTLSNTLNVSGGTVLSNALTTYNGPSTFSNNVIVSGNTTLSNNLNVSGPMTLSNTMNVSGAALLSNTLLTYGATTLSNSVIISGATTLSNTLNVSGAALFSNGITAYNGTSTFSNNVIVSGTTTLSNNLNVSGPMTLSNTVNVSGAALMSNTLLVFGATTLSNNVTISGATTLSNNLNVSGATVLSNAVTTYNGTTTHSNAVTVSGVTTLSNNLNVSGPMTLCNSINVSGAALLSNTLLAFGATTLSNTVTISGATTLSNTLNVSGATVLSNALTTYNGPTTFSNNVIVSGISTLSNNLNVSGPMTLCNTMNVSGAALLSNTVIAYGATTLSNSVTISGATTLSNTLNVSGAALFSNGITVFNGTSTFSNNAIVSGSIGVGTSTLTEKIQVSGGKIYTDQQLLGNSNDSATVPSFSFKEDSNTGMFHASNDAIGFTTAGTEKMRVNSNGQVGIGTTTPSEMLEVASNAKVGSNLYVMSKMGVGTSNITTTSNIILHVAGNTRIEGNLDVSGIYNILNTDVKVTDQFTVSNAGTGPALSVIQIGAQPVADFYDDATLAMRIADGGSVGIKTGTPSETLDVNGSAKVGTNAYVMGNLGVGTSNVSYTLDVSGTQRTTGAALLSNTLLVFGASTFSNNITATGTATFSNNLNVSGNITGPAITSLSNVAMFGSNTAVWASNAAFFGSNTSVSASNTVISLSNYIYTTETTNISWASNAAVFGSNTSVWTSNNMFNKAGGTISGTTALSNVVTIYAPSTTNGATVVMNSTAGASGRDYRIINTLSGNTGSVGGFQVYDQTASAARLHIDSNGNVGLGTTNPGYRLDVNGDINFTGVFRQSGVPYIGSQWSNWSSNVFMIGSNVGINTSNAVEDFHVAGGKIYSDTQLLGTSNDSSNAPSFSFREDSNTGLYHASNSTLGFVAGGVETFRITPGQFTINSTLSIASNLSVGSNISAGGSLFLGNRLVINSLKVNRKQGLDVNVTQTKVLGFSNASNGIIIDIGSNAPASNQALRVTWSNSTTELMRVTGNGNVGIGTSNPAFKFDVAGTISGQSIVATNSPSLSNFQVPPIPMTSNTLVYQGSTYTLTSSFTSTAWQAFDSNTATLWEPTNGGYTSGVWNGNVTASTTIGSSNYNGHWLQVDVGSNTILDEMVLYPKVGTVFDPKDLYIAASIDNTNFTLINTFNNLVMTSNAYRSYPINSNYTAYRYYRLIAASTQGSGNVALNEVLFKTRVNFVVNSNVIVNYGSVGIGTTSPVTKLDVIGGKARIQAPSSSNILTIQTDTSAASQVAGIMLGIPTGQAARIDAITQVGNITDLRFWTTPSNASLTSNNTLYLSGNSNSVGIGTTNPIYKLDVAGDINFTGNLFKSGTTFATSQWTSSSANIYITGSNVGIGNTSPGYTMQVNGTIYSTSNIYVTNGQVNTPQLGTLGSTGDRLILYQGTGSAYPYSLGINTNTMWYSVPTNSQHQWYVAGSVGMTLSNNLLGVGTASPSYTLHVSGNIYSSGNVTAYSDLRAKSNLEVITSPLSKVSQLTGYTYDMIGNSNDDQTKITPRFTGIIAQELEKVLPEAVHKDQEGKYSVAYGNLAGLFVESIKELTQENTQLKERLAKLEALVSSIVNV